MEIMIPTKATAPSTPKRFGECYFSAPPSPGYLSEFYRNCDDFHVDDMKSCSGVPVGWEEKTKGVLPRFKREKTILNDDFAFDVSEEFEKMILPAEVLFDGGKIRPFKPSTKVDLRKRDQSHDIKSSNNSTSNMNKRQQQERGRERSISSLPSSSSRSISPYRVSKYLWEEKEEETQLKRNRKRSLLSTKPELASSSQSSKAGSKKWRLKDFFLFRSASEGRASDKDPLRKYTALFKKNDEKKITSSRMSEGGSMSKRRGPVSAHELHYTKNRAISEDLKKKTFLPYKHGIWGRWFI